MSIYKNLKIKSGIRDYSVVFTRDFREGLKPVSDKLCVIADRNVAMLYKGELDGILARCPNIIVEAKEEHKTLAYVNMIIHKLIKMGIKRDHRLVAIGGGIIQDITGFVSSILYRGMEWFFYPTTLLAQSDSCIGSKTSINIGEYKNQVGNFYPSTKIYLNINFLNTLSSKEIKSGLGEIIKVHLLDGRRSAIYIEENYEKAVYDLKIMETLVRRSLLIKKYVIEKDEFDRGYRNIMNYGHTFGHALESATNYRLPHGQAVTIGMEMSNYLSHRLGYLSPGDFLRMRGVLMKNWPCHSLRNMDLDLFFRVLSRDKKNTGGNITAILTRGPGRMFKKKLPLNMATKRLVSSYFENQEK